MKTHQHALVSLGYAGSVALLAGTGFDDPGIYLVALIGGEILDFVDHPLYHLVYRRNEPHVVKARQLFFKKGLKAAITYLNEIENRRVFKGLLLHNVYALTLAALAGIVFSLFLPASIYWFVFWSTLLLHMLTDICGDFLNLGHADNWLWVLPESWLERWGRLGNRLVNIVLLWAVVILLGFLLVSLRWGWQLFSSSAYKGLYAEARLAGGTWLTYAPLLALALYLLWLVVICAAAVDKYSLELGRDERPKPVPFSLGSVRLLGQFLSGRLRRNHQNLERVLLCMQADQAVWVVLLATFIALTLLGLTWLHWDSDLLLFLTPTFFALLFGTFIHTTIGEFGGVFGVLLAWLLNLTLGHLKLQTLWPISRGYLLFGAAAVAWILGLLGAIFLKGQMRMSVVAFSIHLRPENHASGDDNWLRVVLDLAEQGLQTGYASVHAQLYGDPAGCDFLRSLPTDLLLTPYVGRPILGADHYHLQATDSYIPILREMAYVLCDNRLMSRSHVVGRHGLLPVMPRHRTIGTDHTTADMHWANGSYHWHSTRRPLTLRGVAPAASTDPVGSCWLLVKTWAEFVDHLVTRRSTFQTDLFIYPSSGQSDMITLCGLTRELTSTKEYATVEAEAYAGAVMDAILTGILANLDLCLLRHTSTRLFYPRVSIFDQALVDPTRTLAVLPSNSGTVSKRDLSLIQQSLDALPVTNLLPSVTANFGKQLIVWVIEVAITGLIAALLGL